MMLDGWLLLLLEQDLLNVVLLRIRNRHVHFDSILILVKLRVVAMLIVVLVLLLLRRLLLMSGPSLCYLLMFHH